MDRKGGILGRICFFLFLQFLIPGVVLSGAAVGVSFFYSGLRGEYIRTFAWAAFLVFMAIGILRIAWFLLVAYLKR